MSERPLEPGGGIAALAGPAGPAQARPLTLEAASVAGAIHDVFGLADWISVILQGKLVGTVDKTKVTKDEVLVMIIIGKLPEEVSATDWPNS